MNKILRRLASVGLRFQDHRVICCHGTRPETHYEPLMACCGTVSDEEWEGGHPYSPNNGGRGWKYSTLRLCGNLMHPSCIERYGRCHEDADIVEHEPL